jgi:D-alanine-D-alanine ligase-like ATP-grasp enzyme
MGPKTAQMIHGVLTTHYQDVGITIVNNSYDLDLLVAKQPDLALLGVKKVPLVYKTSGYTDSEVWLSDYLDKKGQNYTGSAAAAISLDFSKSEAKEVVEAAGLKTSAYFIAEQNQFNVNDKLPLAFPLFL